MVEFKTVRIPLNLFKSIEEVIYIDKESQFNSPYEFIIETVENRVKEIKEIYQKKKEKIISDFL